jgi:hypothetical protein
VVQSNPNHIMLRFWTPYRQNAQFFANFADYANCCIRRMSDY